MGDHDQKNESGIAVEEEIRTDEPPMYRVILLNDDYTTMEFVVVVLETVFRKTHEEAQSIMLSVHKQGSGVAGVYTKEVAETKIAIVQQLARQNEYPLKCLMEPD